MDITISFSHNNYFLPVFLSLFPSDSEGMCQIPFII